MEDNKTDGEEEEEDDPPPAREEVDPQTGDEEAEDGAPEPPPAGNFARCTCSDRIVFAKPQVNQAIYGYE